MRLHRILIALLLTAPAWATNAVYVAQSSAGANDGTSCANAKAISYFNTSGNWSATPTGIQIGPATTVHLCGTVTTEMAFHGSGSSGNPVTLLFEANASVQITPGCDASNCVDTGAFNFITIDGGTPCGWNTATNASEGTCNGFIESMLVGSPGATCAGGACTTQTGNNLLHGTGSNIEIRNIGLYNAYVHTATSNDGGGANAQCVFYTDASHLLIHDSTMHDASWCLVLSFDANTSFWRIYNNQIYRGGHGMAIGDANNSNLSDVMIYGNYVHDYQNWDSASDFWHNNGIQIFGQDGGTGVADQMLIFNNIFGGDMGNNVTAQIFNEGELICTHLYIFNNLIYNTGTLNVGNGLLVNDTGTNSIVANNTIVGNTTTQGLGAQFSGMTGVSNYQFKNNLISNVNLEVWDRPGGGYWAAGGLDYNTYADCTSNGASCWLYGVAYSNNFADWQSQTGMEVHSQYLWPSAGLDSNFKLLPGSGAIGAATNLHSTCNGQSVPGLGSLCSDMTGATRPTSAVWDAGAYQFSGSSGGTTGIGNGLGFSGGLRFQ